MKRIAALAISIASLFAQTDTPDRPPVRLVTAVRHWSVGDVTRVAIEVSGSFQIRSDRLHNPERVYFDILNSNPRIDSRRFYSKEFEDKLVKKVRVAETNPGITRVVLELTEGVEISTSQLSNPNRLMIEVRPGAPGAPTAPVTAAIPTAAAPEPARLDPAPPKPSPEKPPAPTVAVAAAPEPTTFTPAPTPAVLTDKPEKPLKSPATAATPSRIPARTPAPPPPLTPVVPPTPAETGTAAKHTSTGQSSLTRALGLKIGRVVIDPGHGGHDEGTHGPKGLIEKDVVLDVAQRVGKLIEDHMSAEVIYTRTDDTFVPLEGRTALANEKKADLFLSIHANSSPYPRIGGVETYYLNFTDSKEAMDVASRENASSQKSVFELQDIIQKISLHEKLDESKEFASRVQSSLFALSSRNIAGEKNRGVKKAPFVVLIGANMPSILAEIGFLTNPREEALLRRPEYRQKVADALFRGLSRYAESLSHFQMAQGDSVARTGTAASQNTEK